MVEQQTSALALMSSTLCSLGNIIGGIYSTEKLAKQIFLNVDKKYIGGGADKIPMSYCVLCMQTPITVKQNFYNNTKDNLR